VDYNGVGVVYEHLLSKRTGPKWVENLNIYTFILFKEAELKCLYLLI